VKETALAGPGEFDQLAVSVWLRLLKAHGLLLQKLRRRVPPELTLPQFDVLAQLHRHPEGMTPSALTRELLVTPGNVTGIVARLSSLGLVEREAVPEDRRAVRLRLTRRGGRLMGAAIPKHRREVGALFTSVDAARLEHLRDLLGELGRGLEARP
jgi:DNA-binding MarR family transcriptional regulator